MELFKPEFGLVFWMFFVFVVLFAILAKYAWPYIIRSIDDDSLGTCGNLPGELQSNVVPLSVSSPDKSGR